MVGLIGLEPMTPALSRRCSNQLSYRPEGGLAARNFKFEISNLKLRRRRLVEVNGFEPLTFCLQSRRSTN
jgi:hypothetical protein